MGYEGISRIVFVDGNGTCRAPMAVGIFRECSLCRPVGCAARGLVVLFPEPLNQKAEAVLAGNGISLPSYESVQLSEEDFAEDTLLLVMEAEQRERVLEGYERANAERVQVLTELVGDELEIFNPYGGVLQAYGLCYESLRQTIEKLVEVLGLSGT